MATPNAPSRVVVALPVIRDLRGDPLDVLASQRRRIAVVLDSLFPDVRSINGWSGVLRHRGEPVRAEVVNERVAGWAEQVAAGSLAQHLPADHTARKMASVEIPVAGVVAAGAARDEPAEPDSRLSVYEMFAGYVSYRVRGQSMEDDRISDGDYLIVKPAADREPAAGDVVVAWIRDKNAETGGHVVKRLEKGNYLKSAGKGRSHKLNDADQVFGVLVGVVRVCS